METKKTSKTFSPEVRARAVRMVQEHQGEHASQWAAISSIASKIGCTGETLRNWVRQAERDQGLRAGLTTDAALKRVPAMAWRTHARRLNRFVAAMGRRGVCERVPAP